MQPWKNASTFIELALSIEQHFPGYVDAYFGPPEIPEALERRGEIPLKELEAVATGLTEALVQDTVLEADRREFLQGEVGAMQTTLRLLQGETMAFLEEVQRLYGITPTWTEEAHFEAAHRALEELFPGDGPLTDRLQRFRDQVQISAERATPLIERLVADLGARTRQRFDLPVEEGCTFEFVSDQPWTAYNWYLGEYRSRIDFNVDMPIRAYALPILVAHEAYPGHHTEHCLKERRYYREAGLLEHAVLLNNTPATVISEGIAECALEVILSPEELVEVYQWILDETGLKEYSGQLMYEFLHVAILDLRSVGGNKLLMLHEGGASEEEVVAYGQHYALTSEEQERKSLQFMEDPMWRS